MKDFLETTIGRIVLGVIVAVVWGVNAFNFSELRDSEEIQTVQQVQNINIDEFTIPDKVNYIYRTSGRDPFMTSNTRLRPVEEAVRPKIEESTYIEPRLTLSGVFDVMAVISDDRGQIFFVETGETFKDDILVKKIVQDSVVLEYKTRNLILKLN